MMLQEEYESLEKTKWKRFHRREASEERTGHDSPLFSEEWVSEMRGKGRRSKREKKKKREEKT
jgi:hypothetical protein